MIKKILRKVAFWVIPSYRKRITSVDEAKREVALKQKVRMRTEEELQNQARGLSELRDILIQQDIPYFISGGTLLGTIREKDFIRWDWDVGLDVRFEDIYQKKEALIAMLTSKGFVILNHIFDKTNFKINAVKYGVRYEMLGYFKVGDTRYRKSSQYPDSFMSSTSNVELRGETYTTFAEPLKYLEWFYGDWKTPRHTAKISAYVTESSRTSPYARVWVRFMSIFR